MGKKLNNAPVFYTVAQVHFNPILNLEAYIPAIQERLRKEHFPVFKHELVQRFVLPFGQADAAQSAAGSLPFASQSRFVFGNIQDTELFLVETNAMSFQTSNYETFETFSATLLKGLSILNDALGLDFVERIGLRYLDAVQPSKESESLKDFLVPEVLGLSFRSGGQLLQSISETTVATGAGQLVSRVVIRDGHVGLPQELTGHTPAIAPRFTQAAGPHAIIDADASIAQREAFELSKVSTQLSALHDEIDRSFRATVTEYAMASWA
ncbi:TIGR04255 family protein [Cupriavidus sp. SZY C1]|uniref:TIGR04255 family protein n=1 Tax=Cupriavidus sp. SZY C1 TaxID=3055037 RepID=UPI0028B6EB9E|nr:TIGR04255 family protein [Cupriavidus sp. SZY C1]MDT6962258.1 TIGR04255 family protein [Cupriavidus sp. SZY C1]